MKKNKFGIPKIRKKESLNHYFTRLEPIDKMVFQWVIICELLKDKSIIKKLTKKSLGG